MTHNSREAERQISKSSESGAVDTTRLEEDGANGSDTVDLSWPLDMPNVNVYELVLDRIARVKAPLQESW